MIHGTVHPAFAGTVAEFGAQIAPGLGGALTLYHHGEKVVDVWTGVRDTAGTPWEGDTMCVGFSTTKGMMATVLARLVDRGLLSYDEPVATWWPEFSAAGKADVTVATMLSHRTALHRLGDVLGDDPEVLLDWPTCRDAYAAATPAWTPNTVSGYHAVSFGWLAGELACRAGGYETPDHALQAELVEPLDLDGAVIGGGPAFAHRRAELLGLEAARKLERLGDRLARLGINREFHHAMSMPGFMDLCYSDHWYDGQIPSANGVFTARSLARVYAAWLDPDDPIVSSATHDHALTVQTLRWDRVLRIPMHWRMGFHRALLWMRRPPTLAFGHYGYAGSGGFADPETGLALGFTVNGGASSTPAADLRIMRIGAKAVETARTIDGIDNPVGHDRGARRTRRAAWRAERRAAAALESAR